MNRLPWKFVILSTAPALMCCALSLEACTHSKDSSSTGPGGSASIAATSGAGANDGSDEASTAQASTSVAASTVAASTAASTAASSSTGMVTSCDIGTDMCSECLQTNCCSEVITCENDAGCSNCLTNGGSACSSNAAYQALSTCAYAHCGAVVGYNPETEMSYLNSDPCDLPPKDWTCDPSLWDQNGHGETAVCNCYCGDIRDPDCEVAGASNDCGAGEICAECGCIPENSGCE